MLEILIKRDGREEPMQPAKLNGWGQWAAEKLENRVDWSQAALSAVSKLPKKASTRTLMLTLIDELLAMETWPAYLMAGRLRAIVIRKDLFNSDKCPTVKTLHDKLDELKLMRKLPYSDEEYEQVEQMIDHTKDFHYPEFALGQIADKYSIRNYVTKEIFETPQFTYMRMAMTIAEFEPKEKRMAFVERVYKRFSDKMLSAPTPNYLYLGTRHRGYASCCIYTAADDSDSLAAGDLIANKMTVNSAGLGSFISTRAPGDPVGGGRVKHSGKFRYFKAAAAATLANKQAARAGAGTAAFMCYDPEAVDIVQYRNPMQPEDKQNRDLHFNMLCNKFFGAKVANNEDIFAFSEYSAPDLFDAFFHGDIQNFVKLYRKYEADPTFKKVYTSARKLLAYSYGEAFNTGTAYLAFMDEANRHTPFKISKEQRIHSPNLCVEVYQPQAPYYSIPDLYLAEDHGRGEISMCNLAAIPVDTVTTDEEYFESCYIGLKMIDYTILNGKYPFPHQEYTAKQRMNAGVGMMGLATHMARKGLRWDTIEGKKEIHRVYERHMYWLIKASIAISKERGLAPWIHKTKWPEGWTPLESYNRNIDKIADFVNVYDWVALSAEIIANGGIAHSILSCMMPGESSSKALGGSNAVYLIRSLIITKKDGENNITRWAAMDGDLLGDAYQLAWDISTKDMFDCYGIGQKWTDGGISADEYRSFKEGEVSVPFEEYSASFVHMIRVGMKGRYYTNSRRPKSKDTAEHTSLVSGETPVPQSTVAEALEVINKASYPNYLHDGGYIPESVTTAVQGGIAPIEYVEQEVESSCGPDGFCKL